jgi:hypothetical protein
MTSVGIGSETVPSALTAVRSSPSFNWAARASSDGRVRTPRPRATAAQPGLAIIAVGYAGYALVRLAVKASQHSAFVHAAALWPVERWLHVDIEPPLNHLTAAHPLLAETVGYYYGLLHFIVSPPILAWLYWRRPTAFGRLRSTLVMATTAANAVSGPGPSSRPVLCPRPD